MIIPSNKIELELTQVPMLVLMKLEREAAARLAEIEAPKFYNDVIEDYEYNTDDPVYISKIENVKLQRLDETLKVAFIRGVKRIVHVPEGIPKLEDQDWIDEMVFLGGEEPKNDLERKYQWLQNVAIVTKDDFQAIQEAVTATLAPKEDEVEKKPNSSESSDTA